MGYNDDRDPVIAAKIQPPSLGSSFLPRRRLVELLEGVDEDGLRLTLVSAPPGYGKTSAVVGWLNATRRCAAWLTLDAAEGDPARFARYLAAALASVRPRCEAIIPELVGAEHFSAERWSAELLLQVASDDSRFTLVLDDYHLIASPAVQAWTTDWITRLPPFVRLVIITRQDPPLPLGRLRAHGQLLEMRADELRATPEEAREFLSSGMSLDLDDTCVEALRDRTEGWLAALQLAGLSIRGSADPKTAARDFAGSHRYVIDYLGEQVLAGLEAETRSFLVRTSIADRFTAELCDALTQRDDSRRLLPDILRSNLFLVALDSAGTWFRYHHLFGDVLQSQLTAREQSALHGLAARWFRDRDMADEAVGHALAGDMELAAQLIVENAPAALESGQAETVLRWSDALPTPLALSNPMICLYRAWACWSTYRTSESDAIANGLDEDDLDDEARGALLGLRAVLSDLHRRPDGASLASAALELLRSPTHFRFMALIALGSIQWGSGQLREGAATLGEAVQIARASKRRVSARYAAYLLAGALDVLGRRPDALGLCRELMVEDEQLGAPPSPYLDAALGLLLYEGGDNVEAAVRLERALQRASRTGFALTGRALWALCRLRLADLGAEAAVAAVVAARRLVGDPVSLQSMPQFDAFEALIRLDDGDLPRACGWLEMEAGNEARWQGPILAIFRNLAETRILIARGRRREARNLLADTQTMAEQCGSLLDRISVAILRSRVAEADGERRRAQQYLGEAVRLAAPGAYVRRFLEDGRDLSHLLPAVRSIHPSFVDALSEAIAETRPAPLRRATGMWRTSDGDLVELPTARELDVLRLVAAGESNRAIASALGISIGTAKWHIVNVLAKLRSTSRTHAVAQARELGLL